MPRQASSRLPHRGQAAPFSGFALPINNTTYTPNQFFDVCLPHCSRGTVRLVAYLIRQTLGWCDQYGNPLSERHALSWSDLEEAGISRDMIRDAIEEAVAHNFVRCIREPRAQKAGQPSMSGLYELRWDDRDGYIKDPAAFRGFFAGEGNRTYIPNQFFDHVVRHETLAVVKVVGSIIRFSIGFQTKWGHRRQNVSLSYQHIQNYSRLRDRKTLAAAVRHAVMSNYIQRIEEGYFDPNAGKLSRAAVYAVKWLNTAVEPSDGRKTPPGADQAKSHSEIPTGNGLKTPPADRSENPTDLEIKQRNNIYKQQPADSVAAEAFERLQDAGFDVRAAKAIADRYPAERIHRQVDWIDRRRIKSNRLGLLRVAIDQDWPAPVEGKLGAPNLTEPRGQSFTGAVEQLRKRLKRPN